MKKFFNKLRSSNDKGQTMVEYILLLAVVIVITTSMFDKINNYLINDPESFQNKYLNSYRAMFQGNNAGFNGQYKYFSIRR